jgi:hypothetical protein
MHLINNTLFVLKKKIILSINSKKNLADIWHKKFIIYKNILPEEKLFTLIFRILTTKFLEN